MNTILNELLDGDYVKISFISIFSFFLVFDRDLIVYMDFIHITASYDVTNLVTHRIFNTDLLCSCAHFIVKINEKSSIIGGLVRF